MVVLRRKNRAAVAMGIIVFFADNNNDVYSSKEVTVKRNSRVKRTKQIYGCGEELKENTHTCSTIFQTNKAKSQNNVRYTICFEM